MSGRGGLERRRSGRVRRLRLTGGVDDEEEILKSLLALNAERRARTGKVEAPPPAHTAQGPGSWFAYSSVPACPGPSSSRLVAGGSLSAPYAVSLRGYAVRSASERSLTRSRSSSIASPSTPPAAAAPFLRTPLGPGACAGRQRRPTRRQRARAARPTPKTGPAAARRGAGRGWLGGPPPTWAASRNPTRRSRRG